MKNYITYFILILNTNLCLNAQSIKFKMDWSENKSNFFVGSTQTIKWESTGIENVKIEYTTDGEKTWKSIEENYPGNLGNYEWLIPNTTSIYCKIRLSDIKDSTNYSIYPSKVLINNQLFSDRYFTIYSNNTWLEVKNPANKELSKIKFTDSNNGYAWGNQILIITSDGGINWVVKSQFESDGAFFIDKDNGWCFKNYNSPNVEEKDSAIVLKTSDGGLNWDTLNIGLYQGYYNSSSEFDEWDDVALTQIYFIDKNYGWLIQSVDHSIVSLGDFNSTSTSLTYRTNDGGETWSYYNANDSQFKPIVNKSMIKDMQFFDDKNGIQSSQSRDLYYTFTSPNMYFTNIGIFEKISDSNIISLYSSSQTDYNSFNPSSFYFINSQLGYFVFNDIKLINNEWYANYCLVKTVNGGTSFDTLYMSNQKGPNKIYFYNDKIGWFYSGDDNFWDKNTHIISMTKDGGNTWDLQYFDTLANFNDLNDFNSFDGKTCWALLNDGTILKYSEEFSNVQVNDKKLIDKFVLMQNYPNPFNPMTNIEFSVFQREYVEVNIYNMLGQKIDVLFSETVNSGNYRIKFDGEKFSSGIYFYELKTKNYKEVKKMLLLK